MKVVICIVRRFIPNVNTKFLKLARPGFDYDKEEHDFIAKRLFDLHTKDWFNQIHEDSIKNKKIDKI